MEKKRERLDWHLYLPVCFCGIGVICLWVPFWMQLFEQPDDLRFFLIVTSAIALALQTMCLTLLVVLDTQQQWDSNIFKNRNGVIKLKRTLKKVLCCLMAAFMLTSVGCQSSGAGETEPSGEQLRATGMTAESTAPPPETTAPTAPPETTEATAPPETTAPTETTAPPKPEPTKATEPPAAKPPATEPPATEPPATKPPATEPPHNHSYAAGSTVAATCTQEGYTTYACSCGANYTDNKVSATGHSWGQWSTTKEATSEAEGQQTRICATCSAAETQAIAKLPAEVIDTAALEEYGRQYGANTYGFEIDVGTRAGYFPGYCCRFTSMNQAYQRVAEAVATTAEALIAYGNKIVVEFEDGTVGRVGLDVEVCHDHDDIYYVWVYYG